MQNKKGRTITFSVDDGVVNLMDINLSSASLYKANLSGANLESADLGEANIPKIRRNTYVYIWL